MSVSISSILEELFYGSGSWLGLLLYLVIIVSLTVKVRYAGLLTLPICIFLAIEYLGYPALMWHSVIMFIAGVFILITIFKSKED